MGGSQGLGGRAAGVRAHMPMWCKGTCACGGGGSGEGCGSSGPLRKWQTWRCTPPGLGSSAGGRGPAHGQGPACKLPLLCTPPPRYRLTRHLATCCPSAPWPPGPRRYSALPLDNPAVPAFVGPEQAAQNVSEGSCL